MIGLRALHAIPLKISHPEPTTTVKQINIETNRLPDFLANNDTNGKKIKSKIPAFFTSTIFYSPNISVNHFKDDDFKGQNYDDRDQIKHGERFRFAGTVGLLLDYHINPHWGLQSGISISSKTIHIDPKTIYAGVDNSGAIKYLYSCSSGY